MQVRYGGQVQWELRTGGLRNSLEPGFDVARTNQRDPDEVAEGWRELAAVIEMPMNPDIYRKDPPGAPNAGCYAIKAAQQQGKGQGDRMARLVREGTFVHAVNFGRLANILAASRNVEGLDAGQFRRDLTSDEVREAFRRDWEGARQPSEGAPDTKTPDGVVRYAYPTFEFYSADGAEPGRTVDYQDPDAYDRYDEALRAVAAEIERLAAPTARELFERYPTLTTREVAVCCDLDYHTAMRELEKLANVGYVEQEAYRDEPWAILWTRTH